MNCRKNVVDVDIDSPPSDKDSEAGGRNKKVVREKVGGSKEESCFSTKSLQRIAQAYNQSITKSGTGKKTESADIIPTNLPRKELIRRIRDMMIHKCPISETGANPDS